MSANLDIVNQALSAIGTQAAVQSFDENSTEAREAKKHYAATRDDILRKYRWGWASTQGSLAVVCAAAGTPENADGSTLPPPPQPWRYAYAYPFDCLKARRIVPTVQPDGFAIPIFPVVTGYPASQTLGKAIPFARAIVHDATGQPVQAIVTNQPQAVLDYTVKTPDMSQADNMFTSALVGRLAAKLVAPLSGDKKLAQIAIQDGQIAEAEAAAQDANEQYGERVDYDAVWITARGSGEPASPYDQDGSWPWA